jgi:transcriptional regulator NrdR family protein
MPCPRCKQKSHVCKGESDLVQRDSKTTTRRRRFCIVCGFRFTTFEIYEFIFDRII